MEVGSPCDQPPLAGADLHPPLLCGARETGIIAFDAVKIHAEHIFYDGNIFNQMRVGDDRQPAGLMDDFDGFLDGEAVSRRITWLSLSDEFLKVGAASSHSLS